MANNEFTELRVDYGDAPLRRSDLLADPIAMFRCWLAAAKDAGVREPNGMTLATCDADGQPHARVVLLKQLGEHGFGFFTNKHSHKGQQLLANAKAAATFWWVAPRARQVRVEGEIVELPEAAADEYFASRPRRAQLCSAASPQSRVVGDRAELEAMVDDLESRLDGAAVERPAHWGGYALRPTLIEFWQGRDGRLHDRFVFARVGDAWAAARAPRR